jgi:hypothetical protein
MIRKPGKSENQSTPYGVLSEISENPKDAVECLQAARTAELNTASIFRVAVYIDGFKALLPLFDRQTP